MNKYTYFCLALIVIGGVFLRLYKVETLGTFRADQAIELSSTKDILFGEFTLIGIKTSISEVRNGAVMYYLLAPLLYIFRFQPIAGAILQTVLQILTVVVTFYIGRKFLGIRSGLIAAFIISFSPLLVLYSRQTLLAYYPLFFDTIVFLIAILLAQKFRAFLTLILGFILGFSMQIHYSVISVLLACLVLPIFFFRKEIFKYYLVLILGFGVGFLPMIVFELRNEFFNTKMLVSHFSTQREGGNLVNLIRFWPEGIGAFLFGRRTLLGALCLVGIGIWAALNKAKLSKLQMVSLLFIIGSLLVTVVFSRSVNPPFEYIYHYGIAAFVPIVILLVSIFHMANKWVVVGVLALYVVINLSAYRFFETNGFSMSPNWTGVKVKKAAEIIKANNSGQKYNVAMLVDGETQGLPLRYFLNRTDNEPMQVWEYKEPDYLYVVSEPGTNLQTFDVWEVNAFRPFKIERGWDLGDDYSIRLLKRVLQN